MEWAYAPDVGHGLALGFGTIAGKTVQVDCGSLDRSEEAHRKGIRRIRPDAFVLTHFHTDHYNGLFRTRPSSHNIETALFPRIPDFDERRRFLECAFAMASRTLGDPSMPIQADYLSTLARMNRRDFRARPMFQGEAETIGGTKLDVLWPPQRLDRVDTIAKVRRAIEKFDEAAESDVYLDEHLDFVRNGELVRRYTHSQEPFTVAPYETAERELDKGDSRETDRDLPAEVYEANKAIRDAANHLSIAFHIDNRLLCFGDQHATEIRSIVSQLERNRYTNFRVTVTPHHGTHWDDSIGSIHTELAVSSVGSRYVKNVRSQFKSISDMHWVTHLGGDLRIPTNVLSNLIVPYRLRLP